MPLTDEELQSRSEDDLLTMIIEEAGEVIQAACKCRRFGYQSYHPDRPYDTNIQELCAEAEQLGSAAAVLGAKSPLNKLGDARLVWVLESDLMGSGVDMDSDQAGREEG